MFELALTLEWQGKFGEEEQLIHRVLVVRRRVSGAQHPATLLALLALGRARIAQHKYADAEVVLRECLEGNRKIAPAGWQRFSAEAALGASLSGKGQYGEAEPLLTSAYRGLVERRASIPAEDQSTFEQTRKWLTELYDAWDKPEQAAEWR